MNIFFMSAACTTAISALFSIPTFAEGSIDALDLLLRKVENDVIELAIYVEQAYTSRCNSQQIDLEKVCFGKNYDACASELPSPTCQKSDNLLVAECTASGNEKCASLFDFTSSSVSISESSPDTIQVSEYQQKHAKSVSTMSSHVIVM